MSGRPRGFIALVVALGVAALWSDAAPGATREQTVVAGASRAARSVTVVVVGDVACEAGGVPRLRSCRQADTAALARRVGPDAVLALGDLQYDHGSLRDFRASYDASWGRFKGITSPIPGNHEYGTQGAAGYFTYFTGRQPGPPGYYARTIGAWRVYGLNTNCNHINCTAQLAWLRRDLAAHHPRCSLFMTHHPRFGSGSERSGGSRAELFRVAFRHHVELFLSGHQHDYERFRPMNWRGQKSRRGVVQFVSGAGGRSLEQSVGSRDRGSRYFTHTKFGVLKLRLRPTSYRFAFKTIGGRTPDSGARRCV